MAPVGLQPAATPNGGSSGSQTTRGAHHTKGGGRKKNHGITVFSYPPPEKKYPTPVSKKVSQPQFFSDEHHWLLFHIV